MPDLPEGKYLLTTLPDKDWNWKRFSVENLANGSEMDVFYFISALGQALSGIDLAWRESTKKKRGDILSWLDSCLIHTFSAMCLTENEDRKNLFSAYVTFLMNFIEGFRMGHKQPSSDVVVRIWAQSIESIKKPKKS